MTTRITPSLSPNWPESDMEIPKAKTEPEESHIANEGLMLPSTF